MCEEILIYYDICYEGYDDVRPEQRAQGRPIGADIT
jgi:hypothetical protein